MACPHLSVLLSRHRWVVQKASLWKMTAVPLQHYLRGLQQRGSTICRKKMYVFYHFNLFMKMYFDFDFNLIVCDCIRWGDVWTWSWHQTVLFLHFPHQQALMVSKHPKQRGLEQSQLQPAPPQHLLHLNCAAQLLPEVLFHTQHINIVDKSCLLTNCILLLVCLCRSMQQCSCGQKSVRLVTRIVD